MTCRRGGNTNFDPHPREGGDCWRRMRATSSSISIHTPARGVTGSQRCCRVASGDFDPHPREGGDEGQAAEALRRFISIHTPARGVT